MMTWRVITMVVAGMLAVGAAREATPAAPGDGLAGTTWHTVRIDGDALFFFVKDVGIRFEDQGRFVAAVRFIDGQQTSKTGTYRVVKPGTIGLTIEDSARPRSCSFDVRGGISSSRTGPMTSPSASRQGSWKRSAGSSAAQLTEIGAPPGRALAYDWGPIDLDHNDHHSPQSALTRGGLR
jgi:hypothetical protein